MKRDEILELLRVTGMSRRDLADKIGVKENIVQRWLMKCPDRTPSPAASTLMRIWLREARGEITITENQPASV